MPSRKQLEQLLESDPDDVFLQYALAMACVSEGDVETGLLRFQAVIDGHPEYVPAYFQKGQALAERGARTKRETSSKKGSRLRFNAAIDMRNLKCGNFSRRSEPIRR